MAKMSLENLVKAAKEQGIEVDGFVPKEKKNKMRKIFGFVAAGVASLVCLIMLSCSAVEPNAGYEAVLVKKPWFFGKGGIDNTPVKAGRAFVMPSTEAIYVSVQPIQAHLKIDNAMTSDGVPLNFDAVIRLQVTDTVDLIKRFGGGWYENNIEREFFNRTRQAIRKHGMNETAINPVAIEAIDNEIADGMRTYLKNINIPVRLIAVTVGKADPPDAIKNQRIETAQQQQRILTEGQKKLAEDARKNAELARAEADNAYRNEMHLSPDQFLTLETIKMKQEVCNNPNARCLFVDGKATPLIETK